MATPENNQAYLVYLLAAEPNSVLFGVDTWCNFEVDEEVRMYPAGEPDACCNSFAERSTNEVRSPSLVDIQKVSNALYDMDRAASVINDVQGLYRWLGGELGQGWALFPQTSAKALVPHWLSPGTKYNCLETPKGKFFLDQRLCPNLCTIPAEALENQVGNSPENAAGLWLAQLWSNMVITRQVLFP